MSDRVQQVLVGARILLLGFDGLICSVFGGYPRDSVVREVREFVTGLGAKLPDAAMAADDPYEVLRATELTGDLVLTRATSAYLWKRETVAAASAVPVPGFEAVLAAAEESGRTVAVVSNHSPSTVEVYLARHDMRIESIIGREDWMFPHHLMPDPFLVRLALVGAQDSGPVLIGGSVVNMRAARAAGIPCVGYAHEPQLATALREAGADAVTASMDDLAAALRHS